MQRRMGGSPNFVYIKLGLYKSKLDFQLSFLDAVWARHKNGYGHLAARHKPTHNWSELPIAISVHRTQAARFLRGHGAMHWDLYFCPNVFTEACRLKEFAKPTNLAWVDIDSADPESFEPRPSVLWQTSPGRTQGLWVWDKLEDPFRAEHYSKALAYRHGADRNGWSITKVLRLPYSFNHKPEYKRPLINVLKYDWSPTSERPSLSSVSPPLNAQAEQALVLDGMFKAAHGELLKKYRRLVHPYVRSLLTNKKAYEADRSTRIFEMVAGLHDAGATPNEIAVLVGQSAYFLSKHGNSAAKLATEINRILAKLGN